MKRLLGLLLVMGMGMVGCGGEDDAPTPNDSQAKVDEPAVQAVDASKLVERDGLPDEDDSETPFTGVVVYKDDNGQKKVEGTYKDGKGEGLLTLWYENGQKQHEATYKYGELVSVTRWDEEGNEIKK